MTMLDRLCAHAAPLLLGATLAALIACEAVKNPLDVEASSRIPAENVEVPANAQLLVDGTVADFECAFASYVVQGAEVGEEFVYAFQTADRVPPDQRISSPNDARYATSSCTALGIYGPLQTARSSAETVINYLHVWTDAEVPGNRQQMIATASAYAGYSYVLLGEGFCSLAFSKINPDRSIAYGGEVTRDSTFKLAVVRFTEAITAAQAITPATTASTDILRMAYLGRARAKLDLRDYVGAKADAAQIPSGYVHNSTYSGTVPRRNNLVFNENSLANTSSSVGEPYRTISASDPRVPLVQSNVVSTSGIRHWYQTKYPVVGSPIPIATYEEAQLIIAEADIRANSLATALPIINASRARGSQGIFLGTTQAEYLTELVDQRRRELFLEGQQLGDIIRFGTVLQPAAGTPYHFAGGTYGNQLCFPLPSAERLNNPLIGS
jgi:starch-binding outer membrane protein, SusD/RagB family